AAAQVLLGQARLLLLELLLELGEAPPAQLGGLVEVVAPLRLLDLQADLLDLLAELPHPLDPLLLGLPLGAQRIGLRLPVRELFAEVLQPLLAGLVFLLLER